jgi:hypothetical protein
LAQGLPASGTPPRIDPAAAKRWLQRRRAARRQGADELGQVLRERADDVQTEVRALLDSHLPAEAASLWRRAQHDRAAAVLRRWPEAAAPRVLARRRGEDASPIDDPRRVDPGAATLPPSSGSLVLLAVQAHARQVLERIADAPPVGRAAIEQLVTAATRPWLARVTATSPRAVLQRWSLRRSQLQRAIRRGEWLSCASVEQRTAHAIVTARQRLLQDAPATVHALPPDADEAAICAALARAVEQALEVLRA